jgi:hypothetical protein
LSVDDGHPKRDVYVCARAQLLVLIASVAPRVVDRVMRNYQLVAANPPRTTSCTWLLLSRVPGCGGDCAGVIGIAGSLIHRQISLLGAGHPRDKAARPFRHQKGCA